MSAEPVEVALVEPARQQLLDLAADVLGRLPADQVPPGLRAIARFAPAKRARLGAVALAAALDGDDDFRERVAQTVELATPELSAAVREGRPTAAADPLDVAVVAYLTRPAGWERTVAAANERWAGERVPGDNRREELAALRANVADLRSRLRGEAVRTRDAVAAAVTSAEAELAAVRKALRERTRELRVAERARDAAVAAARELEGQLAARTASHEAELRRLRARHAEFERSLETARRGTRTERELDDARLWLLVDTLVQAAAGVRRELSLPPPAARPADAVVAAADAGGADGAEWTRRRADDPAALDRLLAMPNVHLVVDGYNVTKTGYPELALADQRTRLIGSLAQLAARSGAEVTVAFDGAARPPSQPAAPRGVRVLFSADGEIADDLIRRIVAAEPAGRPVLVVTSDRQVASDTARAGAWTVASAVFLARIG